MACSRPSPRIRRFCPDEWGCVSRYLSTGFEADFMSGRMPISLPTCSSVVPVRFNDRRSIADACTDGLRGAIVSFSSWKHRICLLPARLVPELYGQTRLLRADDGLRTGAGAFRVGGFKASCRFADLHAAGSVNPYLHWLGDSIPPPPSALDPPPRLHLEPMASVGPDGLVQVRLLCPTRRGIIMELTDDTGRPGTVVWSWAEEEAIV